MKSRREQYLLFRVYQNRDTHAFAELYDVHYANIRRYLLFRLPTNQDADELASEVFLRAWEYATATRVENAAGFFYQLAKRLTADFYRRQNRGGVEEELSAAAWLADDWAERAEVKQELAQVVSCLRKVKAEYRELIVLRYLNDMSVKEIAQALEKTPNNIRVSLHRARKALKRAAGTR